MKNFKEIRSQLNEEYYNGPTAYAGGDRTNVGDIAGADLGGLADGGKDKPYVTTDQMKVLEKAIKNKKENWNHNLAGQIDSSFIIEDKNNWFFKTELLSCIDEYLENTANQKWIIPELLN